VLILFLLVPAATFFLGSRATITQFLWSHYPQWFLSLRECAACSGFWDTLLLALFLRFIVEAPLPLLPNSSWCPLLLALCGIVVTPIVAAVHDRAMRWLGGE